MITIRPLNGQRWPDLEAIFTAKGRSFARGRWCMFYRESGKTNLPGGMTLPDYRRAQVKARADRAPAPGLIAYHGKVPVGWVAVAPRHEYAKLVRSSVMKPVDDKPVWSIICFVVPSQYRHQGVATALLQGAISTPNVMGRRCLRHTRSTRLNREATAGCGTAPSRCMTRRASWR